MLEQTNVKKNVGSSVKSKAGNYSWPLPYRSFSNHHTAEPGEDRLSPYFEKEYEGRIKGLKGEADKLRRESSVSDGKAPRQKHASTAEVHVKDSINYYFSEMKRFKLLSNQEEKKISARVMNGDSEARKMMIEANLRLVVNIARRYLNKGFPLEDLIEEGNIGLIKAVERFRPTKGCRFSTYATFWIKQTIERALSNTANVVRLPIHITTDIAKVSRASKELMMELHREPSFTEIADRTGFSGRYVKKLDIVGKKSFSLESSIPDSEDLTLLDKLEDDKIPGPLESVMHFNRAERVGELLGRLDESERKIVELRFGFAGGVPQTLEEIGNSFGVTRERVRQIESKALGKLRNLVSVSDIASLEAI
ncbi:MAG: RNA polymerase sigma factor RpoD/SigA [Deltaproteobacteria bacterium]|nr:RNA polymerase sigma factor RpoD/SigA [Deltaproteobacteria bacterium]